MGLSLSSDVLVLCDLKRKVMGRAQSQAVGCFALVTGSMEEGGHSPLSWIPHFLSQSLIRAVREVVKWTGGGGWWPVWGVLYTAALASVSVRDVLAEQTTNESRLSVSDSPFEDPDLKDIYLIPRHIMAEPDYIEDDNPELIRPQKLVNPVKTSRNHQDLHRELLMNQKR